MPESLGEAKRAENDTYAALAALNCPSPAFTDWLRDATARGAAALQCWLPGVGYDSEVVLPLTALERAEWESVLPTLALWEALGLSDGDWLADRLGGLLPTATEEQVEGLRDLAAMLAPGQRRRDGLPGYWPSRPGLALARTLSATLMEGRSVEVPVTAGSGMRHRWRNPSDSGRGQRNRADGRGILAAVAFDLVGCDLATVSGGLLGLHDHEKFDGMGGRGADRYKQRGRRLLSSLSVWPWCHAPEGKLPRAWRTKSAYVEPLYAWLKRSRAEFQVHVDNLDAAHRRLSPPAPIGHAQHLATNDPEAIAAWFRRQIEQLGTNADSGAQIKPKRP